jgi:uncharacterized RmlC-like cupin family protein
MAMAQSVRANFGSVVRASESYHGKQGLDYTLGVSAEKVDTEQTRVCSRWGAISRQGTPTPKTLRFDATPTELWDRL